MKTKRGFSTILKGIASFLLLVATIGACAANGNVWKEEILLHNGQTMMMQRSQSYGGRSEPGQSAPIKEHRISFQLPGSKQSPRDNYQR